MRRRIANLWEGLGEKLERPMPKALLVAMMVAAWGGVAVGMVTISRQPTQDPAEAAPVVAAFGERWAETADDFPLLKKADREAMAMAVEGPAPIKTEKIVMVEPEPSVVIEKTTVKVKRKTGERDVCQRHHLKKVWVSRQRWRCK